ncbi:hypothetical protein [Candidatus Uabimicrobium amorphum]|uniref:Uncharacterized protein n=1 Tax=Uabimicrobium amorphum TaxID=2596890 RepID=A0A5S9IJL2_UABAM|nr:hypothetical protein [Candidatus Uabimicrobium amorphum]BBM83053.1 hypothetical protein UABAM_01403 [Candidatus Uabimicrobium amorphum]
MGMLLLEMMIMEMEDELGISLIEYVDDEVSVRELCQQIKTCTALSEEDAWTFVCEIVEKFSGINGDSVSQEQVTEDMIIDRHCVVQCYKK